MPINSRFWGLLLDVSAKAHLARLHHAWTPSYVISSSWGLFFNKTEIIQILERGGLSFVAQNMHDDWATPKSRTHCLRSAKIGAWLDQHPEPRHSWVIVDDTQSGSDLLHSTLDMNFIVLCQEGIGLQQAESEKMQQAFQRRCNSNLNTGIHD